MGNTQSYSELDSAISVSINAYQKTMQNCEIKADQQVHMDFKSCGGDMDIENIDINQLQQLSPQCAQTASSDMSFQTQIQNKFSQLAESISQNLDLNPGDTDSTNVVRTCINLSDTMTNIFQQDCSVNSGQYVALSFDNQGNQIGDSCKGYDAKNPPPNMKVLGIDIDQVQNDASKCIQNSSSVQNAVNNVKQSISQTAKSTVQNALFGILALIVLLIAIVVLGGVFGGTKALKPLLAFAAFIIAIVGGYMGVAYWQKIYPFQKEAKDPRTDPYEFPANFEQSNMDSVCRIALMYKLNMDMKSWPTIKKWLFPKADKDDLKAATELLLTTGCSDIPPNAFDGCDCSLACSKCTSDCDKPCTWGICKDSKGKCPDN